MRALENQQGCSAEFASLAQIFGERFQQGNLSGKKKRAVSVGVGREAGPADQISEDLESAVVRLDDEAAARVRKHHVLPAEPILNECEDRDTAAAVSQAQSSGQITSVRQRLAQPGSQPELRAALAPRRKHLMCKLKERCKDCNQFVLKVKVRWVRCRYIPVSFFPVFTQ